MDRNRVVVNRPNVSLTAAEIMQRYFVNGCNNPDRPSGLFAGAIGAYDTETSSMTIEAELRQSTSETVGREAISRAFGFAEAIDVAG
ncbi:hypothetical protein H7142_03090 [Candidatus Saccharibacteria bacterium]|nr:hypothetical protein [Candidatus Saccharibacteria bacterium]